MPTVPSTKRLAPRNGVACEPVSTGALLVDLDTGACWELNHVGADLWNRLKEGDSVAVAIERLGNKYDVAPNVLRADVASLLETLLAANLLVAPSESRPGLHEPT